MRRFAQHDELCPPGRVFLPEGEGVDGAVLFQVFSLEVGAGEFSGFGGGGTLKVDAAETVGVGAGQFGDGLEVLGVVGGDVDAAGGSEGPMEVIEVGLAEETALVVSLLGPRVGEVDVVDVHGFVRDAAGDEVGGVGADYADVADVPAAEAVNGPAVVLVGPLDAEEVDIGLDSGLMEKERPLAAADLDVDRAGASENLREVQFFR